MHGLRYPVCVQLRLALVDRGLVPEPLLRRGIRQIVRGRLSQATAEFGTEGDTTRYASAMLRFVESMRAAPIALVPDRANAQHYEVPARFFELVLGKHRKYSCAYYPTPATDLDAAEQAMLKLTCERARLADGQQVLELGCGWGSLTLAMASWYPNSQILAVSNSHSQREAITGEAQRRGLTNVVVETADMNGFSTDRRFDRVVSVEMFEHMRNWERLLSRVHGWLRPDGLLFQHFFAHRRCAYPYLDQGPSDWMTRHFFSGGMMPSHTLLEHLDIPFEVVERWSVAGTHYQRTAEDWLTRHRRHRREILDLFRSCYGPTLAGRWYQRWRVFFLACAELFGFAEGREWFVSHNLSRPLS